MAHKGLAAMNVVPAKHHGKHESTLEGMPGYIKTGQGEGGRNLIRGTSSIGPHPEGPIGKKGHKSTHKEVYHGEHSGSMVKSYKAESTGKPGHYRMSGEGPGKSGPPQKIGGHPGRMEKLSGHALTHAEGRKKSQMY